MSNDNKTNDAAQNLIGLASLQAFVALLHFECHRVLGEEIKISPYYEPDGNEEGEPFNLVSNLLPKGDGKPERYEFRMIYRPGESNIYGLYPALYYATNYMYQAIGQREPNIMVPSETPVPPIEVDAQVFNDVVLGFIRGAVAFKTTELGGNAGYTMRIGVKAPEWPSSAFDELKVDHLVVTPGDRYFWFMPTGGFAGLAEALRELSWLSVERADTTEDSHG